MVDISTDFLTYERQLFSFVPTREQLDRLQAEHTKWVANLRQTGDRLSWLAQRAELDHGSLAALGSVEDALNTSIEIPFTQAYADLAIAQTLWKPPTGTGIGGWPELKLPELATNASPTELQQCLTELANAAPLRKVELGAIREVLAAHAHKPPAELSEPQRTALTFVNAATPNLLAIKQSGDLQVRLVRQASRTLPSSVDTPAVAEPEPLTQPEPLAPGTFNADRFRAPAARTAPRL